MDQKPNKKPLVRTQIFQYTMKWKSHSIVPVSSLGCSKFYYLLYFLLKFTQTSTLVFTYNSYTIYLRLINCLLTTLSYHAKVLRCIPNTLLLSTKFVHLFTQDFLYLSNNDPQFTQKTVLHILN